MQGKSNDYKLVMHVWIKHKRQIICKILKSIMDKFGSQQTQKHDYYVQECYKEDSTELHVFCAELATMTCHQHSPFIIYGHVHCILII